MPTVKLTVDESKLLVECVNMVVTGGLVKNIEVLPDLLTARKKLVNELKRYIPVKEEPKK